MGFSHSLPQLLLVGAVSGLVLECGGATEPTQFATSYDLVSYEGRALPVETRVLISTSTQPGGPTYSCSDRLTGMHLQFLSGNSYTESESRLLVCDDGSPDTPSSTLVTGTYALSGETLELIEAGGSGYSHHTFAQLSGGRLTVYRQEVRLNATVYTVNTTSLVFVASP